MLDGDGIDRHDDRRWQRMCGRVLAWRRALVVARMYGNPLKQLAGPEGLEPPTTWFEARCSIQLSYGPTRFECYFVAGSAGYPASDSCPRRSPGRGNAATIPGSPN